MLGVNSTPKGPYIESAVNKTDKQQWKYKYRVQQDKG